MKLINQVLCFAARLYSLGIEVEAAREQLRKLVEQGIPTIRPKCEKP